MWSALSSLWSSPPPPPPQPQEMQDFSSTESHDPRKLALQDLSQSDIKPYLALYLANSNDIGAIAHDKEAITDALCEYEGRRWRSYFNEAQQELIFSSGVINFDLSTIGTLPKSSASDSIYLDPILLDILKEKFPRDKGEKLGSMVVFVSSEFYCDKGRLDLFGKLRRSLSPHIDTADLSIKFYECDIEYTTDDSSAIMQYCQNYYIENSMHALGL